MTSNNNNNKDQVTPMQSLITRLLSSAAAGSIRVKSPQIVVEKLTKMKADGPQKLQVISDFDYTLSRHSDTEGVCWTSHQVFDEETLKIDPVLGKKLHALRDHYMPIEFSPTVPRDEKQKAMVEWWTQAHDHIVAAKFNKHMLEQMVQRSRIRLRDGAVQLIHDLHKAAVPVQIFSAGLGDIIHICLQQHFIPDLPANVCLVSNLMTFSPPPEERIVGFTEPLIHTFNKNSSVLSEEKIEVLAKRDNVLLMGDTIGDTHMSDGLKHSGTTIKIGFLNARVESLLESYMDAFDIVLINDQSMNVPATVIHALL